MKNIGKLEIMFENGKMFSAGEALVEESELEEARAYAETENETYAYSEILSKLYSRAINYFYSYIDKLGTKWYEESEVGSFPRYVFLNGEEISEEGLLV